MDVATNTMHLSLHDLVFFLSMPCHARCPNSDCTRIFVMSNVNILTILCRLRCQRVFEADSCTNDIAQSSPLNSGTCICLSELWFLGIMQFSDYKCIQVQLHCGDRKMFLEFLSNCAGFWNQPIRFLQGPLQSESPQREREREREREEERERDIQTERYRSWCHLSRRAGASLFLASVCRQDVCLVLFTGAIFIVGAQACVKLPPFPARFVSHSERFIEDVWMSEV